jgi:hypothetical protein
LSLWLQLSDGKFASFSATVPNFEADPNFATDHTADGVHTVSVEQQDPLGNVSAVAA